MTFAPFRYKNFLLFLGVLLSASGTVFYLAFPALASSDSKTAINAQEIKKRPKKAVTLNTERLPKMALQVSQTQDGEQGIGEQPANLDPASEPQTPPATDAPDGPDLPPAETETPASSPPTFLRYPESSSISEEQPTPTSQAPAPIPSQKTSVKRTTQKSSPAAQPVAINLSSLPKPLQNLAIAAAENSLAGFWQAVSQPYNYANTGAFSTLKTNILYMIAFSLAIMGIFLLGGWKIPKSVKRSSKLGSSLRQAALLR